MQWTTITVAAREARSGRVRHIHAKFEDSHVALRFRKGMALFRAERPDGAVALFFSPATLNAAPRLMRELGAANCDCPKEALAQLSGDVSRRTGRRASPVT